jgi:hypothetical protein
MSLNQDARYSQNEYYNVQYNNIKTEGNEISILGDLIIEDIPDGASLNEILVVDANNRVHKKVESISGADVSSSITSSLDGEICIFDGTSGKVIKNSNIKAINNEIDFVAPFSRTKISKTSYSFKDQANGRIAHNIGSLDGNTNQFFSICCGGEIDDNSLITANNSFVYLIIYFVDGGGSDGIRFVRHLKKLDCIAGNIYTVNDFDIVYSIRNDGDIFELQSNLQINTVAQDPTGTKILTRLPNNLMGERDLSTNPFYNQSLNTTDNVSFNEITTPRINTTNIYPLSGNFTFMQSPIFQINSTQMTASPTTNINFAGANSISLANSSVDFTGSTITGLSTGDVNSSTSSVLDNQICRFDGTTGKLIKSGLGTISDTGNLDTTSITTLQIIMDPSGTLFSQNVNNFDTSLTNFTNSTLNCTNTSITNQADNPAADRILTLDPSGILTERNITLNPWYNQPLDINSSVQFGTVQLNTLIEPSTAKIGVLGGFDILVGDISLNSGNITNGNNITVSGQFNGNSVNVSDVNTSNTTSQGTNNFTSSTTNFTNSLTDFTGSNVNFSNMTIQGLNTDDINRKYITFDGLDQLVQTTIIPLRGDIFLLTPHTMAFPVINQWELINSTQWQDNLVVKVNTSQINFNQLRSDNSQNTFISVAASISFRGSNTSNNLYQASIFKNGAEIPCSTQYLSTTEATLIYNTSLHCQINCTLNDVFDIRIRNTIDNDGLTIEKASLDYFRISD